MVLMHRHVREVQGQIEEDLLSDWMDEQLGCLMTEQPAEDVSQNIRAIKEGCFQDNSSEVGPFDVKLDRQRACLSVSIKYSVFGELHTELTHEECPQEILAKGVGKGRTSTRDSFAALPKFLVSAELNEKCLGTVSRRVCATTSAAQTKLVQNHFYPEQKKRPKKITVEAGNHQENPRPKRRLPDLDWDLSEEVLRMQMNGSEVVVPLSQSEPVCPEEFDHEDFMSRLSQDLAANGYPPFATDLMHEISQAASQQIHSYDEFQSIAFEHDSMNTVRLTPLQNRNLLNIREQAAQSGGEGLTTFADSLFKQQYKDKDTSAANTRQEAWDLIFTYLQRIEGKAGFSKKSSTRTDIWQRHHAAPFLMQLQAEYEEGREKDVDAVGSQANKQQAAEVMVRCWTSTERCPILLREWCSLLQAGMRLNDKDLTPILVRIWSTMNVYCVLNRSYDKINMQQRKIAWPGPLEGEEENIFHRGGRLPSHMAQWWQEACSCLLLCRSPSAVAVSKQQSQAMKFMHEYGYPDPPAAEKVYFRFHLRPEGFSILCQHAVCLDLISVAPAEQEFLFPPFSSFQALSIEWISEEQHWIIDVRVIRDNKEVADDVPLCPWL